MLCAGFILCYVVSCRTAIFRRVDLQWCSHECSGSLSADTPADISANIITYMQDKGPNGQFWPMVVVVVVVVVGTA